ncbi:MAG: hypothetical protein V4669_11430 [Pseudomonadota bacterium]
MGTMIDYAYRFEGSAEAIASARAAIESLQAKHADVSGNGNCDFRLEPARGKDGSLAWRCYATGGIKEFESSVAKLTKTSDLSCYAYWGCTDGDCASALNFVERGKWQKRGAWRAEIGIEAALAIRELAASANAGALLALVDALRVATSDGWDEDDYPWLLKAAVVASAISAALSSHRDLIREENVVKALLKIKGPLGDARDDLEQFGAGRPSERAGVARLLSTIEGLEIAQAVPEAKSRGRRAMAL